MMYDIYYGELSEKRKENWDNGDDDNPFEVLKWRKEIRGIDVISFFHNAKKHLRDEVKVDWGSFAWKGTREEILAFAQAWRGELEDESVLQAGIEYGVVFIEMY